MGKIIPEQNQEKKLAADSESFGIASMFYEAFVELAKNAGFTELAKMNAKNGGCFTE